MYFNIFLGLLFPIFFISVLTMFFLFFFWAHDGYVVKSYELTTIQRDRLFYVVSYKTVLFFLFMRNGFAELPNSIMLHMDLFSIRLMKWKHRSCNKVGWYLVTILRNSCYILESLKTHEIAIQFVATISSWKEKCYFRMICTIVDYVWLWMNYLIKRRQII